MSNDESGQEQTKSTPKGVFVEPRHMAEPGVRYETTSEEYWRQHGMPPGWGDPKKEKVMV